MRKALLGFMLWCLLLPQTGARADVAVRPVLRALLIGSERFVTHPNTAPAATSNLRQLSRALRGDARGYASIRTSLNQPLDEAGFGALVRSAFSGAKKDDISFFYITTHGVYQEGRAPMEFAMVLSDGHTEFLLTAEALYKALKNVPGTKVLVIDTCNSGAVIDRGMPGSGLRSLFADGSFRVLTASGGSEPSFLWATGAGNVQGGTYFAGVLLSGISAADNFSADTNRDGDITLKELHSHMLSHYGVSTPHAYPLDDPFVLLRYKAPAQRPQPGVISGVVFEQDVMSRADNFLDFSYTLSERIRVVYQLVYLYEDDWNFTQAQYLNDSELDTGETLPGRKQRSLRIDPPDEEMAGYALMFLTTAVEDRSTPYAMKLLMVEPGTGDPELAVAAPKQFAPHRGEELPITVNHGLPIRVTLRVLDERGNQVRMLVSRQPTRPQHLPGGGSMYYWNGRGQEGRYAPPGNYRIVAECAIGGQVYFAASEQVVLR